MIVLPAFLIAVALPPQTNGVDPRGACLDSRKEVPSNIGWPLDHTTQVVKIEKIVSTATMSEGEVVGFLYTRQDGATFAGSRTGKYMAPASWDAMNQLLASTHLPDAKETTFSVRANGGQFLQVQLPPAALGALNVRLSPCVAWPAGRELPDPTT